LKLGIIFTSVATLFLLLLNFLFRQENFVPLRKPFRNHSDRLIFKTNLHHLIFLIFSKRRQENRIAPV